MIHATLSFVRGYLQKPKPRKEAFHHASKCAKVIAKLAQKLGADFRRCREDAALVVLGHEEGNFREEMFRLSLNDPLRTELWWQYYKAFEKADSAKMILREAMRSLREIESQKLAKGRPAHVAIDTWVGHVYGIWKQCRSDRYSYHKPDKTHRNRYYTGLSLNFMVKVLNLVKPQLRPSVLESLPTGIQREPTAYADSREINAIGQVVHKLSRSQLHSPRRSSKKVMANNTSR